MPSKNLPDMDGKHMNMDAMYKLIPIVGDKALLYAQEYGDLK